MKDFYRVLGVPRSATQDDIKQAYRNLIKACHPDLNPSPKAAEWTRELNDAYATLSDPQVKMSYDMDLRLEEARRQEADPRQAARTPADSNSPETRTPPKVEPEPTYSCEKCRRTDSSLRVSAIWQVLSAISYQKKWPEVKILCGRCRIKQSLSASAFTAVFGWWGIIGFFWTLEALIKNAAGGEQPTDNNALLLNAVGYQLYRAGRYQDAYKAFLASLQLKRDHKAEEALHHLREYAPSRVETRFWERLRNFELHPIYYHLPAGALGLAVVALFISVLTSFYGTQPQSNEQPQISANTFRTFEPKPRRPRSPEPTLSDFLQQGSRDKLRGTDMLTEAKATSRVELPPPVFSQPEFSEPELPMPEEGGLDLSVGVLSYEGTLAPLKVTTKASTAENYVMKVVDWNTGKFVATYFIKSGSTLSIDLPLGTYKLKFASGEKWYGSKHLFGLSTLYSYIPDRMDFRLSGDYAMGHRIELIPQIGGNLNTRPLKPEDW